MRLSLNRLHYAVEKGRNLWYNQYNFKSLKSEEGYV